MNIAAKPLYDVIFKMIKNGGVTSRRCAVRHHDITTGVGGNPQRNHNSTKVILDGPNAGMIHQTWGQWGHDPI
jgi:hypothetical protein